MTTMFEVDADGYRAQMSEMKPVKVVYELVANANDEDSVKVFTVNIRWVDGETVIEYQDSDVWTLYGHSTRRADPTKSGRFNLGEKEFLVLSKHATVETFDKQEKKRRKFVFQNNSRVEDKKVKSEHYWVKDQSENGDKNKLDRKRSHKRRRKIRKPIKGLR